MPTLPTVPYTVPNQKTVVIHREMPERDFIQVKKENFYNAYRELNATATILYLYLVGNRDNYELALSPVAVSNAMGMPESTCRDQINKLVEYGYLVRRGTSNTYDFYETPHLPQTPSVVYQF